ncbi:MAG: type II asparaginase [Acidaminococcaceae bacterium]|nr:type II asparaginase [Acidaminococcaceae bacterium]MDD4722096.1 type II asparaginase [Acidaminococcaceae bacterium]
MNIDIESPTIKLPRIKILATGGTIAGSAAKSTQMSEYKAGAIGIQTLLEAVPQIKDYANITGEQLCQISSNNITDDIWLQIADRVNAIFQAGDTDGIVIAHGTDTLEETAYFLNLVIKNEKPLVLVGAMRPATAISADGPNNLLNAVRLAGNPEARNKGVLIAMNDEINGAREATKTNTSHVSTFRANELGYMGYINNGEAFFYRASLRKHTLNSEFSLKDLVSLPYVEIIYGHANDSRILVDAAVNAGARGIVYAGMGNGSIHEKAEEGLIAAQKQGVVIVRSSRCGAGTVKGGPIRYSKEKFLTGDSLNPQKARILLSLALTKTDKLDEIQRMFNEY